jgi:hypothetical protein
MSAGTRMPRWVISCSTPSASRSFAQNTAVGRCPAGCSAIWRAAARPEATVRFGVDSGDQVGRAAGSGEGGRDPGVPVGHLRDRVRATDERDPLVARGEEVLARQPAPSTSSTATEHRLGRPEPRSTSTTGVPRWISCSSREDGVSSIGVMSTPRTRCSSSSSRWRRSRPESSPLLQTTTITPVVGHRRLGPADDVGEERVGHVEHDDRDLAAASGPQLAGRVVADIAERGDRVVHPLPCLSATCAGG